MKEKIFKIHTENNGIGTCFFCKIPFPDKDNLLPVLITNNHLIDEECLDDEKKLTISINNEGSEIIKTIELNNKKKYTNEEHDITIIEIKEDKDQINSFLELDPNIMDENCEATYASNSIYTIGYPNCRRSKSFLW